ncbi:mitotic arrest-deficient 1 [Lycorma delicatula]|uniref:mitotic arrest-deficient 1 n=1 Tax=Lycorma delicatula TaxID=130591 RepID=UPI003F518848
MDSRSSSFNKILHDFRTDSIPGRRISAINFPGLGDHDSKSLPKPVKLDFDDSFFNETENLYVKKRKVESDTPENPKLTDSYLVASPWESRKMKADLVEARSEIVRLESRISQMETVHKETLVLFEKEKKSLQKSLEKERYSTTELEHRLKTLRKREADTKLELLDCQGALKQEKLTLEKKYQNILQEHMLLKSKFSELDSSSGDKVSQLERKLEATEQLVADIQEELSASKEMMKKLQEEVNEKRAESRLWESDKAKISSLSQRVKELLYEKESSQKTVTMVQAQQTKLLRLFDLEKEVATLKDENKNLRQAINNHLVLEDVVTDLRSRVAVLQEREQEIVTLKTNVRVTQYRLQEWTDLANHILGPTSTSISPIDLRQLFEKLQKSEIVLTSENTQAKSKIKSLEDAQVELQSECEVLRSQISRLKTTLEQNNALVVRLRKQNSLITWERNDLRELVDSCQKEFTMTSSASLDMQHLGRIEALEKVLEGYRKRSEQLEADPSLAVAVINSNSDSAELSKLKVERDALLKEKEELTKKIEELNDQLEYRALKGDFDIRQTKILHLRSNPTAEASSSHASEIEKYQVEIALLRERVNLLQEGKTHDLTQMVNERVDINTGKEIEELKEKLSSQEKQNQKLREVFKLTSLEFREAINMLLGYKVDGLPNKKYRLSSIYAETPDQNLVFKMSQNGGMALLETPYSETLSDLIDVHLHQEHSIPVFLAAITIQLFQKQSMYGSIAPQSDPEIILSD